MKGRSRKELLEGYKSGADLGSVGIEIVLSVLLGFFGGRWLDGKFGSDPWLQILGFLAGLGAATKAVMRAARQMNKIAAAESREQGDPAPLFERDDPAPEQRAAERRWSEPPASPSSNPKPPSSTP